MDAHDRIVRIDADLEARRNKHAIVLGLAVDVLDLIDALDDRFERLGDEFDGIDRAHAVGAHRDIDQAGR